MNRIAVIIGLILAGPTLVWAGGIDLHERYSGGLEFDSSMPAHDWTAETADVYALDSFRFARGEDLLVETGPAALVIGHHEKSALWAVVVPDKPGKLRSPLSGKSDDVVHIWLRFHPARIAELFPSEMVKTSKTPEDALWQGKRIAAWKMSGSWQAGDRPVVPSKGTFVVDLDTGKRERYFFMVDDEKGEVKYVDAFARRALPKDKPIDSTDAALAFDEVWDSFDREYAMFAIKPNVNWTALKGEYRSRAAAAKTRYQLAAVIGEMLAHLEDLHTWVRAGEEWVPVYDRKRPQNASWRALEHVFPKLDGNVRSVLWGRTNDNIGYVAVNALRDGGVARSFDQALESLADTWGMVIDLRFNGGGDELLARKMAGRFLDKSVVYAKNQYRNGPKHSDLGDVLERACEPCGPWRYESPVVVLCGQRTMSSAEAFVLMFAQAPQVTTMGDRTAGASANPRTLEVADGIVVNMPRWVAMDADGKPFETVGIAPDVRVEAKPEEFTPTSDPVLEAALKRLRGIPAGERKPGKRP